MKKALKITGIVLICLFVTLAIVLGIFFYSNLNYWQGDYQKTLDLGFTEKQFTLDDGSVINYAEGPDNGDALVLIHGQTGAWEDYCKVIPKLSENWHVFAVDCYGHGSSTHDESKYYIKANCDDIITMINTVIKEPTVISGHSSGGLMASYIAAYGGEYVRAAVLEDPPVFSTEPDYFEKSFAYVDTYKPMHDYINSDKSECWEAFYLRNCLWGKLYMASTMPMLADNAESFKKDNPDKAVQLIFVPSSLNAMFLYMPEYDLMFGEHFYDYTWHCGIDHAKLMSDINIPTVFLHAKDAYSDDGILMAASTDDQARRAVELIGDECELTELVSGHNIHGEHPDVFIDAINKFIEK